jgi:hypothetical protein
MENIKGRDAVQAFTGRRLLLAGESITRDYLSGNRDVDFNNYGTHEISIAVPGAPGGSIFITKDFLRKVGFWEDVFFSGYSVEDQFFLNKIMLMGAFSSCDFPPIELIHLWHSREHQVKTNPQDFVALDMYDAMPEAQKREYIAYREQYFSKFYMTQHANTDC